MSGDLDEVLAQAAAWRAAGHDVALATVVRTWGSSPRPPGSQLVVADDGEFRGSVSGGCIEGAVVKEAQGVLRAGAPKLLHFGVTNEMAWEVGLACGGKVDVWVERADPAVIDELQRARAVKEPVVLATWLDGGEQKIVRGSGAGADPTLTDAARRALVRDEAEVVETARGSVFIQPQNPALRLIVVGAVHIAQPLARLASVAGFDVTIVDPRTAFASTERFPDVKVIAEWPDTALPPLGVDRYTAFVALTHDPKIDDPALTHALARDCFYIGALGSKKTHARRVERLKAQGIRDDAIARIHSPIGLDISAVSPPEIAVAIMGEITARLRAGAKKPREQAA